MVIAAITSCTNTSNPSVMLAAGLVAKKAVERGLRPKPWVKTSLAPGSRAVTDYMKGAGLEPYLDALGFQTVGYGCTTCIGNSGPLIPAVADAVDEHNLIVASVLSGNRNFEGRVHAQVRASFLASPPLVVAYALAGTVDIDLTTEPLGCDANNQDVYLRDIWPTQDEVRDGGRVGGDAGGVLQELRQRVRGRRVLADAEGARPASCTTGTRTRPTCRSRRTSATCRRRRRRRPTSRRRGCC